MSIILRKYRLNINRIDIERSPYKLYPLYHDIRCSIRDHNEIQIEKYDNGLRNKLYSEPREHIFHMCRLKSVTIIVISVVKDVEYNT